MTAVEKNISVRKCIHIKILYILEMVVLMSIIGLFSNMQINTEEKIFLQVLIQNTILE